MPLSDSQVRDLREGLRHRERYYALHGGVMRARDDESETDLAMRWFCEWWRERADNAALRHRRKTNASNNAELPIGRRHQGSGDPPTASGSAG